MVLQGIENVRFEVITLAHELGHHESFKQGERPPGYTTLMKDWGDGTRHPDRQEISLILSEEQRAWNYGRRLLQHMGFTEWASFNMRQREGMSSYREVLFSGRRIGEVEAGNSEAGDV